MCTKSVYQWSIIAGPEHVQPDGMTMGKCSTSEEVNFRIPGSQTTYTQLNRLFYSAICISLKTNVKLSVINLSI